jgi:hypothetical protein
MSTFMVIGLLHGAREQPGRAATTTWFERKVDLFLGAYFMAL